MVCARVYRAPADRESFSKMESAFGGFFNDPVDWYRNIFSQVPSTKVRQIAAMLKAIHAGEDIVAARQKAVVQVIEKLRALRPTNAAELVVTAVEKIVGLLRFPGGALLAAHPHQSSPRAYPARNPAARPRRRSIP